MKLRRSTNQDFLLVDTLRFKVCENHVRMQNVRCLEIFRGSLKIRPITGGTLYLLPLVADNGACKVYASEKDMSKVWSSSACEEGVL